jgi:hypothetical protein
MCAVENTRRLSYREVFCAYRRLPQGHQVAGEWSET